MIQLMPGEAANKVARSPADSSAWPASWYLAAYRCDQCANNGVANMCERLARLGLIASAWFRSEWRAEAYATIHGSLAAVRKQGQALLAALHTVFAGQPFYPASAWPGTTPVPTR